MYMKGGYNKCLTMTCHIDVILTDKSCSSSSLESSGCSPVWGQTPYRGGQAPGVWATYRTPWYALQLPTSTSCIYHHLFHFGQNLHHYHNQTYLSNSFVFVMVYDHRHQESEKSKKRRMTLVDMQRCGECYVLMRHSGARSGGAPDQIAQTHKCHSLLWRGEYD